MIQFTIILAQIFYSNTVQETATMLFMAFAKILRLKSLATSIQVKKAVTI